MSLNIDIKRILLVKVFGVSPKSLSRSVTLPQTCNVVNPGKMFYSNSDSIIVTVAFVSGDLCSLFLPSFVGLRMLMNLSKTQHKI